MKYKTLITVIIIALIIGAGVGLMMPKIKPKQCFLVDTQSLFVLGHVTMSKVATSLLVTVNGLLNDDFLFIKTERNTYKFVTVNEYVILDTNTNIITARDRKSGVIATYEIVCE